ncbi:hypothetical protein G9A89_008802 [Geosiphon pyriformis]|nr:hypothetical protein G9A89_008802 [Geosiphon pyriformis]
MSTASFVMNFFDKTDVSQWAPKKVIEHYRKNISQDDPLAKILYCIKVDLETIVKHDPSELRRCKAQSIIDSWKAWANSVKESEKVDRAQRSLDHAETVDKLLQVQHHLRATEKAAAQLDIIQDGLLATSRKRVLDSEVISKSDDNNNPFLVRSDNTGKNYRVAADKAKVAGTEEGSEGDSNLEELDDELELCDSDIKDEGVKQLKEACIEAKKRDAHQEPIWWRVIDLRPNSSWQPLPPWLETMRKMAEERMEVQISDMTERFIIVLSQLPLQDLEDIARDYKIIGSQGVLKRLSDKRIPVQPSSMDRLEALLTGDTSSSMLPSSCVDAEFKSINPASSEIIWILDCLSDMYFNTKRGIPQRTNTERDIDIYYSKILFNAVEDVVDIHYGEMCSRTSRERRQGAVDGTKDDEGSKLDWLFSRHDLGPHYYWGQEFGIVENAGPKCDNKAKVAGDSIKTVKNLRDMLLSIRKKFPAAGMSSTLDKSYKSLVLPGLIVSSWGYQVFGVTPIDNGWFALAKMDEFSLPITMRELRKVLKCCQAMLKIRELLKRNTEIMRLVMDAMDEEKYVPAKSIKEDECRTPAKKKRQKDLKPSST